MDSSFFIAAFITGLVGSAHCVGMCGPLALAVHRFNGSKTSTLLQYFSGKSLTYAILGGLAGWMGVGILSTDISQLLSVVTGIALVFVGINQLIRPAWWHHNRLAVHLQRSIAWLSGKVLQKHSSFSGFFMGMVNGLLPCGLVYLGLIGSIATGNAWHGVVYMLILSAGALPAMLVFVGGMYAAGKAFQWRVQRILPYAIAFVGLLLILRGAALGIPFISPQMPEGSPNMSAVGCN